MAAETKANGKYSTSDKLAIALACLSGVIAIILFLVEKTPLTVSGLLGLMVILSIYPILHLAQSKTVRLSLILCVIAGTVLFGWKVWPNRHVDAASQQKQEPSVQQSNQGDSNTNLNAPNNQGVIIIERSDPKAKSQLARIEKLLKTQQNNLTPDKLLSKYPLGYVIFDVNYQNEVFPYQTRGEIEKWHLDWNSFSYSVTNDSLSFSPPTFTYQDSGGVGLKAFDNTFRCRKVVGQLCGSYTVNNVRMLSEILAVHSDVVVLIFGFKKMSAQPAP
jgi:hypothetical protein